jgi:uncharacterized protein YecA (UPF0149 family)
MNNLDVRSVLPLLQQMGVDPSKLGPDKLERLMKMSDKIKNPDQITPEVVSEITNIFGIDLNGPVQPKKQEISLKIGRNEKCPCESGKKWKKCCGN